FVQNLRKEYSFALSDHLDTNLSKGCKEIKKFVFFGVCLGRHIPRIARRVDASIYVVMESNLGTFRRSLFTVGYTI
ncbi:hypothetical protein ACOL22_12890, partial [Aliarcobacter butzleri]